MSHVQAVSHMAYSSKSITIGIEDSDPRPDIGLILVDGHAPTQIRDVNMLFLRDVDGARPVEVVPLGLILAV